MPVDDAETRTAELLSREHAHRHGLRKMLMLCEVPRSTAEIESAVLAFPEMKVSIFSPTILLSWLTGTGGIERVVVEGAEAEEEEVRWQTTAAGKKVIEREAPDRRLRELLDEQPRYRDIYLQVLRFCQTPRTRPEVESLLQDNPVMEKPKVYASFFLQNLEEKGGLEWVDSRWQTTEAGEGVLE